MASKKSFMDNEHLYRLNRDDIKTKQETLQKGEDQDQDGAANVVKTRKIKARGLTSLQDSSDEDEDEDRLIVNQDTEKKEQDDHARHLTF